MRGFEYFENAKQYLNVENVQMLSSCYEHKGKQELFIETNRDELTTLLDVAKIQSTKASNAIEGIFSTDKRIAELVKQKNEPKNRNEQEISGYRDVLSTIHESYDFITPSLNVILQLHRDLYSYTGKGEGGVFKSSDNVIAQIDSNGNTTVRFKPVSAFETKSTMEDMCGAFIEEWNKNRIEKLVIIPMFILDFLCIHPFNDGNGRMSRLLTLLLLYKAGFIVGKYISIEMIIEKTKESYYETLQRSGENWHDGKNDYDPFIKYFLGVLLKAYSEFEERVAYLSHDKMTKSERIENLLKNSLGKTSKKDILEKFPDISTRTAERTLNELLNAGKIEKVGAGPTTAYVWKAF